MSSNNDRMEEGAVRVIVRERPVRDFRGGDETTSVISYSERCPNVLIVDGRPFTFDKVLEPTASQEQLFLDVRHLVGKVKQGYNCTALAYGQTGAGKSYSMGLNSNSSEGVNVGVIPRCLSEILHEETNADNDKSNPLEIHASFIEIYNEKVFDLLSDNATEPIISRGYKYTGGTRKELKTVDDCYSVLQQGNKNRHVRPTKMNSQSSRSHAIFTIHVRSNSEKGTLHTRLNLVDLAGSEGVRRTGHQGVAMSEGVNINQGLLSIGKVLQAKALGHKVIPYRDSVLTLVLQESLNENSYLTLLACISPHRADLSETLSTLRFAQSVKQLKHSPHINEILAKSKPRMKTPKKIVRTPAPVKRPYSKIGVDSGVKAVNPIYHSNTFCTPSKLKRNPIIDKLNRSEMGLTPKQKEKEQTSLIPPLVPVPRSTMHSNLPRRHRESSILLDQSLDSRASILSINVSSSTIYGNEGPTSSKFMSYSPVVRKCMVEIENVMENKMSQLMETLKDLNKENFQHRNTIITNTPCSTPWTTDANIVPSLPLALRQEFKSIIQEVLSENADPKGLPLNNRYDSSSTILESSILKVNPKCQLFTTSSPVFKVPDVPNRACPSAQSTFELPADDPQEDSNRSKNSKRRSRRISQRLQQGSFMDPNDCGISSRTLRRSYRLSMMRDEMEMQSASNPSEIYRKRKFIKQLHNKTRQSIRHAVHAKELESDKENEKNNTNSKRTKNVNNCIAALNNSVIESYFGVDSQSSNSNLKSKKQNIKKHRKAILDLLNTGSMKELQILPHIGQKTAFQLITQRTLSGKFKNLTELEKLPIWRGNSWTRFAQANLLVD